DEQSPIGTLLDTVDRMFRVEAEAKGLEFVVKPTTSHMSAPPLIVMRVLSNLVSNAIRHTAQGTVEIETQVSPDDVAILVCNSHPDPQSIDFDVLFTAGNKGETSEGSGLGLAIAREQAANIGLDLSLDVLADSDTPVCFRLSEKTAP
ncbi:MAG: HAMP domain-containing sensor histidine kinase, partial [Pseudomonadota bacterium]